MDTTIKLSTETKDRLLGLDLSEKGKTFDMIVNDLATYYETKNNQQKETIKKWHASFKNYEKDLKEYYLQLEEFKKQEIVWKRLLAWAKTKGFK